MRDSPGAIKQRRRYSANHKSQTNARKRRWAKANPEKAKAQRKRYEIKIGIIGRRERDRRHNLALYGLSIEDFDQLLTKQRNRCALCGSEFAKTLMRKPSVDHDHSTGEVRGLLCGECNIWLSYYERRRDLLDETAAYLMGSHV